MIKIGSKIQDLHGATLVEANRARQQGPGERLRQIRDMRSTRQRLGALASYIPGALAPGLVLYATARKYEKAGYEFIGAGYDATALRRDREVIKIMRRSASMDADTRERFKDDLRERIAALGQLSEFIPQTQVEDARDPVTARDIVALRQPFIHSQPIDLSIGHRQLPSFLEAVGRLPDGVLPDIAGGGNLRETEDGRLILVDTIAVYRSDDPETYKEVKSLLTELGQQGHSEADSLLVA